MGALLEMTDRYFRAEVNADDDPPFVPRMLLEPMTSRVAFASNFGNATALDTDDGLVMIDTGGFAFAGLLHAQIREWNSKPLHTAIYTHGHVDHVFGTTAFEDEPRPRGVAPLRVIAHEGVPARFDRYQLTDGYNACINSRQFKVAVEWPKRFRYPDETFRSQRTLEVGGISMELHHARGETDDHTWVWLPGERVLCTGDLFIWAAPNAGNPQKVQRFPREWAQALREMSSLGADMLLPGHGPPIAGADRVRQALDETAELLESLVAQTLDLMNAGARLDEVLECVRVPEHLARRPYLRPLYDEPEFVVRNIWRLYGGWYDGNPANLKPAREASLAFEVARLAGGARALVRRAEDLEDMGELALAAHLAEFAALAAPADRGVLRVRARIYAKRSDRESSLMARNIFRAASEDPAPGKRVRTKT